MKKLFFMPLLLPLIIKAQSFVIHNDLIATQPNWFYVFAFEGKDLPGLQKQIMEP